MTIKRFVQMTPISYRNRSILIVNGTIRLRMNGKNLRMTKISACVTKRTFIASNLNGETERL